MIPFPVVVTHWTSIELRCPQSSPVACALSSPRPFTLSLPRDLWEGNWSLCGGPLLPCSDLTLRPWFPSTCLATLSSLPGLVPPVPWLLHVLSPWDQAWSLFHFWAFLTPLVMSPGLTAPSTFSMLPPAMFASAPRCLPWTLLLCGSPVSKRQFQAFVQETWSHSWFLHSLKLHRQPFILPCWFSHQNVSTIWRCDVEWRGMQGADPKGPLMFYEGVCLCSEDREEHLRQVQWVSGMTIFTVTRIVLAAIDWRGKIYSVPC